MGISTFTSKEFVIFCRVSGWLAMIWEKWVFFNHGIWGSDSIHTIAGWWFGFLFSIIHRITLPIDDLIFFNMVKTTNQIVNPSNLLLNHWEMMISNGCKGLYTGVKSKISWHLPIPCLFHCQGQQWPLALQLLSEMKHGLVAGNATWMLIWDGHILWYTLDGDSIQWRDSPQKKMWRFIQWITDINSGKPTCIVLQIWGSLGVSQTGYNRDIKQHLYGDLTKLSSIQLGYQLYTIIYLYYYMKGTRQICCCRVSKIRLWNGEFTKQRSVDIIGYNIATANAQL